MKAKEKEIQEFLKSNSYRDDFAKILEVDSEESNLSFLELKKLATEKLFGKSKLVDKSLLIDEISILERCIKRDLDNYNSQTKYQKNRSILSEIIKDSKEKLNKYKEELINLQ